MTMTRDPSRSHGLPRRALGAALVAAPLGLTAPATWATTCPRPGAQAWAAYPTLQDAGLDPAGILKAEQSLYEIPTTSLMIVRHGMVAYTYGDVTQPSYFASARKSLLSMLYGKYVSCATARTCTSSRW